MKKASFVVILLLAVGMLNQPSALFAQKKLAQTGFQFLSVGTDARATAMGEALTTVQGSSVALFYNPAGMVRLPNFLDFRASRMTWIADIEYVAASMAINVADGRYGIFGLSIMSVDYGDLMGTVVANNEQGFIETGTFSPNAYLVGLGYANALTDRFSVGGQIKFVSQSLGKPYVPTSDSLQVQTEFTQEVFAFDFGTLYQTGFKSLAFGMTVRNFSRELKFAQEGFQLPLTFKIGFSIDLLDFLGNRPASQSFLLSLDAINPRSFSEFITVGGEYKFMDLLALRFGYVSGQDDYAFTAGFGVKTYAVAIDYSYTPFDVFKDVHRVSFSFSL